MWVVGGVATWVVLAFLLAVVVGRGIRLADRRSPGAGENGVLTTADLAATPRRQPAAARVRRRAIPLSPLGIGLIVVALGLETTGFLARLTGSRSVALSMDAPFSMPRLFVALLFAVAAAAAMAGAGSIPGRRTWWLAVALVGGGVAAVKAGSTVHADALHSLTGRVGAPAAVIASAALATAVVGVLWFLS